MCLCSFTLNGAQSRILLKQQRRRLSKRLSPVCGKVSTSEFLLHGPLNYGPQHVERNNIAYIYDCTHSLITWIHTLFMYSHRKQCFLLALHKLVMPGHAVIDRFTYFIQMTDALHLIAWCCAGQKKSKAKKKNADAVQLQKFRISWHLLLIFFSMSCNPIAIARLRLPNLLT